MRVLITGGLGVNGVWVTRSLVNRGVQPVILETRLETAMVEDLQDKIIVVEGDVLDLNLLLQIIQKHEITHIVHLAAVMPDEAQKEPLRGFTVNALGTIHILEAAKRLNVERVVVTSSKAVYAPFTGDYAFPVYKAIKEDYPLQPVSVYGAAKLASEYMCLNYYHSFGLDVVILRFSTIYGPGKLRRHGAIAQHSKIIENAMLGKQTLLPTGADEKDDMVYVKDVASAIVQACLAGHIKHRIFNIGTGIGVSIVELANAVRKVYPKADIQIGPGLNYMGGTAPYYGVFDISLAMADLGYHCEYDIDAGVQDYVASLTQFHIWPSHTV